MAGAKYLLIAMWKNSAASLQVQHASYFKYLQNIQTFQDVFQEMPPKAS
jgi:hypothetical protein